MRAKDEQTFNIMFVKKIEKYPVVYHSILADYSDKEEVDGAWNEIASSFDLTPTDCKGKWRNIRTSFRRYLRQNESTSKQTFRKDYYLASYLTFLHANATNQNNVDDENNTDNLNVINDDLSSSSSSNASLVGSESIDNATPTNEIPTSTRHLPDEGRSFGDTQNSIPINFSANQLIANEEETNPDMSFLRSLLPDVTTMTQIQRNKFKIATLNLINNILYEQKDIVDIPTEVKTEES